MQLETPAVPPAERKHFWERPEPHQYNPQAEPKAPEPKAPEEKQ